MELQQQQHSTTTYAMELQQQQTLDKYAGNSNVRNALAVSSRAPRDIGLHRCANKRRTCIINQNTRLSAKMHVAANRCVI